MITFSLQSGSNGNAIYVEAGGKHLLFDAGISGKLAELRMAERGRDIRNVDALIISHEHNDHVRCAGIYHRKFGMPIYMTPLTRRAVHTDLGRLSDLRPFYSGDTLIFGDVLVHTLATGHDAVDGVAFIVEHDGRRLGILTDLGHPFPTLREAIESVDAAYLECNYDPQMLEQGGYPPHLKQRIRGKGGHLSNAEAAGLLKTCGRKRPDWLAVAHLSQDNNRPKLAIDALHGAVGTQYPVHHAPRHACSAAWEV